MEGGGSGAMALAATIGAATSLPAQAELSRNVLPLADAAAHVANGVVSGGSNGDAC